MKKNETIKKIVIVFATIALGYGFYHFYFKEFRSENLVHFNEAHRRLAETHDQQQFENYKKQLQTYYTNGAYENDIRKISSEAKKYFADIPTTENSIIIFDVDDTALYNWHSRGDFIWDHPKFSKMKQKKFKPAIEPVLDLYKYLINKGFKIIFITSRSDNDYDNTHNELVNAGYSNFFKLILMPTKLAFDPNIKTADWKLDVRKELAHQYNIVGSIGDRPADFLGGYTGYIVKIPNYLY
jgi:predicted secreted acid phosphatase